MRDMINSIHTARPRTPAAPPAPPQEAVPTDSFQAYWPYYLSKHRHPGTRMMHFCGVAGAMALAGPAATLNPWLALAAPVWGYGMARLSHKCVEHGEPAALPALALRGDAKMFGLMLRASSGRAIRRRCTRSPDVAKKRPSGGSCS